MRRVFGSLFLLLGGACHLGRPPISDVLYQIGPVEAATAEPALPELIQAGLGRALAEHSRLGTGPEVQVVVRNLSTSVDAVGVGQQVHRVHVSLSVTVVQAQPRSIVVEGSRSYSVAEGETIGASAARSVAIEGLVIMLMKEAVDWMVFAPGGT